MRTITLAGKCSTFGGPRDSGVAPGEGTAIYAPGDLDPFGLFLPNLVGFARGLNPDALYCACRWQYSLHSRAVLKATPVLVGNPRTGFSIVVHPADWGPYEGTGRVIDLSPGGAEILHLETDDDVIVAFLG